MAVFWVDSTLQLRNVNQTLPKLLLSIHQGGSTFEQPPHSLLQGRTRSEGSELVAFFRYKSSEQLGVRRVGLSSATQNFPVVTKLVAIDDEDLDVRPPRLLNQQFMKRIGRFHSEAYRPMPSPERGLNGDARVVDPFASPFFSPLTKINPSL